MRGVIPVPFADEHADQIAAWHYEPPYDFYDGRHEPVRNPERFFAAHDASGSVVGFYYFELKGDVLEYGLGLRPDLTGHGHGLEFFQAGLEYGRDRFRPRVTHEPGEPTRVGANLNASTVRGGWI